jgi:hypothetical protein
MHTDPSQGAMGVCPMVAFAAGRRMMCIRRPSTSCCGISEPRRGRRQVHDRVVTIMAVIRSSPFVGLCYDTQHVEAMLFPVALPDTPPCRM